MLYCIQLLYHAASQWFLMSFRISKTGYIKNDTSTVTTAQGQIFSYRSSEQYLFPRKTGLDARAVYGNFCHHRLDQRERVSFKIGVFIATDRVNRISSVQWLLWRSPTPTKPQGAQHQLLSPKVCHAAPVKIPRQ